MVDFRKDEQTSALGHKFAHGPTRFKRRDLTRFGSENGKAARKASAGSSFVPSSPFDGQSLAGTGALVFEGELLRR